MRREGSEVAGGTSSRTPDLLTIERVAVLQRVDLFAAAPGHALVAVARVMDEVRFAPDDVVIERGAVEDWLFIVADGRVRAHIGDRILSDRGPGEVIGELTVLSPAARSASVTAIEHSLLLRLRRRHFEELIEGSPAIALAVTVSLARRLQELADEVAKSSEG